MKRLAVVGASGVVGKCVLKVLEEFNLPIDDYIFFSSKKSAGSKITFMDKLFTLNELKNDSFNTKIDYAIFCAGSEISKKYIPIAQKNNCISIDNSSAFRMNIDVPLVVPEVNPEDIKKHHGIIANPNCSTIQAMLPLKALDNKYKIKRIIYSTYQAVSGAGRKGIEALENHEYPIYNNCVPHIDVFENNGYTKEEMKMINETKKILHKNIMVTATCVRVPVINSHSESINVELEKDFKINELITILENFEGIKVFKKNDSYPLSTDVTGYNEVYVGRIRRDNSIKLGVNLWVVADNIRKGASTNAVQILKYLINKKN